MYLVGHKRDQGAVWLEMYTINRATDNPGKETEIVVEPLKESLIEKKNNSKVRFQKKKQSWNTTNFKHKGQHVFRYKSVGPDMESVSKPRLPRCWNKTLGKHREQHCMSINPLDPSGSLISS